MVRILNDKHVFTLYFANWETIYILERLFLSYFVQ